jgi:hypothetical protein
VLVERKEGINLTALLAVELITDAAPAPAANIETLVYIDI